MKHQNADYITILKLRLMPKVHITKKNAQPFQVSNMKEILSIFFSTVKLILYEPLASINGLVKLLLSTHLKVKMYLYYVVNFFCLLDFLDEFSQNHFLACIISIVGNSKL